MADHFPVDAIVAAGERALAIALEAGSTRVSEETGSG